MAHLKLENVTVEYPIYNGSALSLRKQLVSIGTGGLINRAGERSVVIRALDSINLDLKDGDSIGLTGHNGAGKTTLLRTLAGIYSPRSGIISRSGRVSTIIELGAGLDSELTGYENIRRLGYLYGMSGAEIEASLPEIEAFTELGNFLAIPVRTYSSGMLMRLMFAVATSIRPDILLIDEMFGTGDAAFQDKAYRRMQDLIESAKIFVFASHAPELIEKYCKRRIRLEHGKLIEQA